MGGMLDSARFKCYLSQALHAPASDIEGLVIGGHGDTTMIPLTRFAAYKGIAASALLDKETLDKVAADTMVGGATLTKMLGTSAWYAPGAAGALLVEAIIRDQKKVFPCCVFLDGEYGEKDICLGVPVVVGKHGWERIVQFDLNAAEQAAFKKSADAVRAMNYELRTKS
jgi:malate dehydrogenase